MLDGDSLRKRYIRTPTQPFNLRRFIGFMLIFGSLVGIAVGSLGFLWIGFDLFSHFRLHFVALFFLALIILAIHRGWLFIFIAGGIAAFIGFSILPNNITIRIKNVITAKAYADLKLMSFNIWSRNETEDKVLEAIIKEDADIVFLLEMGPRREGMLKKLSKKYPYQVECLHKGECHLAFISKYKWIRAKTIPSKHRADGKLISSGMIEVKFGRRLGGVTFIGTHLSRVPAMKTQLRQANYLKKYMIGKEDPIILAGDFNATPWSYVYHLVEKNTRLSGIGGNRPTWPAWLFGLPQLAIDHIFISPGIVVEKIRTGERSGSDHLPLIAKVKVPILR